MLNVFDQNPLIFTRNSLDGVLRTSVQRIREKQTLLTEGEFLPFILLQVLTGCHHLSLDFPLLTGRRTDYTKQRFRGDVHHSTNTSINPNCLIPRCSH